MPVRHNGYSVRVGSGRQVFKSPFMRLVGRPSHSQSNLPCSYPHNMRTSWGGGGVDTMSSAVMYLEGGQWGGGMAPSTRLLFKKKTFFF